MTEFLERTRLDWRNGVDSPYEQLHRKDPQVVGDGEEGLTVSRPKRSKMF
jgi:hypothetical protein